jgi:hypothetical protein
MSDNGDDEPLIEIYRDINMLYNTLTMNDGFMRSKPGSVIEVVV